MHTLILTIHIIISVLLIGLILLQSSKGGLTNEYGGEHYRSKRGAEKIVFRGTIVIVILFFITSIASLLVK